MSNQLLETNKILEMDKEHLREIDGVVMDLDSYARHVAVTPPETPPQTNIPQPVASCPPATQAVNPPPPPRRRIALLHHRLKTMLPPQFLLWIQCILAGMNRLSQKRFPIRLWLARLRLLSHASNK